MSDNYFPTLFQYYIHLSRYSRWLPEKKRRETMGETVDRYFNFFEEHLKENTDTQYSLSKELRSELQNAVIALEVMPSMRALMTAGEALKRDSIAGYNCAYVAIDSPRAFDEILHILMNGTGVGFSVESKYVEQLPGVEEEFHTTDTTIQVADSKLGWAKALKELIHLLYAGQIPRWDVSKVRPAGTPLKTFGGRASGPDPLVSLFNFCVDTFKKAAGRRLTTLECHDIVCKIAEIVVVGGVRRSALISLSDLSDDRMRMAKSGAWWEDNVQRALANNSFVAKDDIDVGIFMKEWLSLYESKSGERGIFSRVASKKQTEKFGRRDSDYDFGTNPSLARGTKVVTREGIFNIEDLEGKSFFVNTLDGSIAPAKCFLSSPAARLYEITLPGNISYHATEQHKWPVVRNGKSLRLQTTELCSGDLIPVNHKKTELPFGNLGSREDGFLIGWNLGDGWISRTSVTQVPQYGWGVYSALDLASNIHEKLNRILNEHTKTASLLSQPHETNLSTASLNNLFALHGVSHKSNGLPTSVWSSASEEFRKGLIDGIISSDGSVTASGDIIFVSVHEKLIDDLASLFGAYGLKVRKKKRKIPNDPVIINGKTVKNVRQAFSITISDIASKRHFSEVFSLSRKDKQERLEKNKSLVHKHPSSLSDYWRVKSVVETDRIEPVWDITVNHEDHSFELDHCQTGNCSEIILRNREFCNLTEVVVRSTDTVEDLKKKVRLATILGTFQSTLTNFKFISKKWKENCEEERLLGVSLTGIMDNEITNGKAGNLEKVLEELRDECVKVNREFASVLGIPASAAITCVKPSGTVSSLVDSASGIHARHSPYYIRTVRADKKDPLAKMMVEAGFPVEDDVTKPLHTHVFSFPMKSPEGAVCRKDMTAIEQLELWLKYQRHWCEHKPSITVSVKEHEWPEVGAWVWNHFDEISGVSFLPYSDHIYKQAPFQDCTKEEYELLKEKMPQNVDWSQLSKYEITDQTTSSQELACVAGGCEL